MNFIGILRTPLCNDCTTFREKLYVEGSGFLRELRALDGPTIFLKWNFCCKENMAKNSVSYEERKVQCYGLWEKGVEDVGHGGISKHGGR